VRSAEGKKKNNGSNGNFREGMPMQNLARETSVVVRPRVKASLRMSIAALQIEL
jgi:hypothetical protein